METLRAMTAVYSYYLPEIRALITDLTREYPHDVFLRSVNPGLDDFHHPILARLVERHAHDVPYLAKFAHRYPTSGSEEGIREYVSLLKYQGVERIYVWKGEYEGYKEVAKSRGIATVEVEFDQDPRTLPPGRWFLSNPSARDGMIVPAERVAAIANAGHKIFYDLAYLGATQPATFDLGHPNVVAAVISFSKPFGLFYHRVGFTFTAEPVASLEANKWFKNVFSLLIAEGILERVDQAALTRKYKKLQAEIVGDVARRTEFPLECADAFLLAKISEANAAALAPDQRAAIQRFRRGPGYRLCLTPYFHDYEQAHGKN